MSFRRWLPATLALLAVVLTVSSARSVASGGPAAKPAHRGPAAVGALFTLTPAGKLGQHFCTATVVHSPGGDTVATAAHCLAGRAPGTFAFVPGYAHGRAPLGVWVVRRALVDRAWTAQASPDDDFAFLVVARPGVKRTLEALTGAERLAPTKAVGKRATVVGYPASADAAIACSNALKQFSGTQVEFDCDGYTNGTSGSAIVVDADSDTGLGTIVGVIGGFEQGGATAAVSYAAVFGPRARSLYQRAAQG